MRQQLLEIFESGLAAVKPDQALLRHLTINGTILHAAGRAYDLSQGTVRVAGAGKGAAPMAKALENLLGNKIKNGVIAVKYDHTLPLKYGEIIEAAHPVPDMRGVTAANKILELAAQSLPADILICLFTGGASALLPAPVDGLSLEDLRQITSALLASGADITELNAVRKHLSRLSGGQLARATNGARVLSIIVSDVVGDDLATIASGPTAPDPSTYGECLNIIAKYGLEVKIPAAAMAYLEAGAKGEHPETPKPGDAIFERVANVIVASNTQALEAAAAKARQLGMETHIIAQPITGDADRTAGELVEKIKRGARNLKSGDADICILAGGETTVTITGTGKGGRNQEMALAAAIALAGESNIGALFAGTDGTDGPTDAAGGFAFGDTAEKLQGQAEAYLADNDSYAALKKSGELLITGPTLTNVMDLAILIAKAPKEN